MAMRDMTNAEVHAVCLPNCIEWLSPGGRLAGMELASQSFYVEVNLSIAQALGGA